jgi:hypothetical protein
MRRIAAYDDDLLKLKLVAELHIASVHVGCDCTDNKSKIYFSMYLPAGVSNVKIK